MRMWLITCGMVMMMPMMMACAVHMLMGVVAVPIVYIDRVGLVCGDRRRRCGQHGRIRAHARTRALRQCCCRAWRTGVVGVVMRGGMIRMIGVHLIGAAVGMSHIAHIMRVGVLMVTRSCRVRSLLVAVHRIRMLHVVRG